MALLEVRTLPGERIPSDLKLWTIDIAVGGARCASNVPLADGAWIQLTFTLVGGDLEEPAPIEVEAVVLRCTERPGALPGRRYEMALEFVRIGPRDRKTLQAYLNAL
jgi:hypothetical protein